MALQNCATVEDFEQLIIDMERPTRLEGNFGVIDANGGAAYFELGNFDYVKYDANNPDDAPNGYIIRTNYSFSGKEGDGGGYIRYVTINDVFEKAVQNNTLDFCTIIQDGSRNLKHSLLNVNYSNYDTVPEHTPTMVFFKDLIPRNGTSSSCVVQGVKPGEDTGLTMMWSLVGFPLTSLTVPIWLNKDAGLPQVVEFQNEIQDSPISSNSLKLKEKVFAFNQGVDKKYYIDINQVVNADKTGFVQQIVPVENQIIEKTKVYTDRWQKAGKADSSEMKELYQWIDKTVYALFNSIN